MDFTLNRNKTLISTQGHGVVFIKNQPTYVPQPMWAEAQAIGAVPVSEIPEDEKAPTQEPENPVERTEAIMAGFGTLIKRKVREDFMASGYPHVKALASVIGFVIDSKERDALWNRYKQSLSKKDEE